MAVTSDPPDGLRISTTIVDPLDSRNTGVGMGGVYQGLGGAKPPHGDRTMEKYLLVIENNK